MMQAQVISAVVNPISKTINCGQKYIFDLEYVTNESLCVSVVNTKDIASFRKFDNGSFRFFSTRASYLCFVRSGGIEYFIFSENGYLYCWKAGSHEQKPVNYWCLADSELWKGYAPNGIASCKSGGILVSLWNKQMLERSLGKVIKLSLNDHIIRLEIEIDKNRPLFTCPTYITENGNEDVCVSDVNAVVVTDAGGLLRFRYKGLSDDSQFDPYGICSDSQNNIIIADMMKNRIHMIDQNGEFLHYIQYRDMNRPRALCIDEDDNLYVGEWSSEEIKVLSRQ
ncbi:uncharacterized protein LOC133189507 [Saccostrea echinata]|uniref:uncharacterized protein LOC133189507 n=1 Tax=Saccostrea echinata TaxID=191078 RepID=UPI002A82AD6E|nr:uncharacterized protein LOC133189507 [Saccostrea echinata]